MELASTDDGNNGEHCDVGFVEMSKELRDFIIWRGILTFTVLHIGMPRVLILPQH